MDKEELIRNKEMFNRVFGKNLASVHMYFLKHLGRYNRVLMDIPRWTSNGWEDNFILKFQEVQKGAYFKREFLEQMGVKNTEDLKKKFTIYYELYDKSMKIFIGKGFFESEFDAFNFYLEQMTKAKNLQEKLLGVIPFKPIVDETIEKNEEEDIKHVDNCINSMTDEELNKINGVCETPEFKKEIEATFDDGGIITSDESLRI